jgi:hypothetical protein
MNEPAGMRADEPRPRPKTYGQWWNGNEHGLEWYQQIHAVRTKVHDGFVAWFEAEHARTPFRSVMEVGCGRAYPYAEFFAHLPYTGVDISSKEIDWCRQHYRGGQHRFWCGDVLLEAPDHRADLVFSHAVIDHVWDINRFLARLVALADRAVYVTAFRGWFPDLATHRYQWLDGYDCYNNDVSVPETRRVLEGLGCRRFEVFPAQVDNAADKIDRETVIVVHK